MLPATRVGRTPGIWGPVYLESKARLHMEEVFVQPDIRRQRVTVDVTAPASCQVRLRIEDSAFATEGEPGQLHLDFPDFDLWSPEKPVLYTLAVELLDGETVVGRSDGAFWHARVLGERQPLLLEQPSTPYQGRGA